MYLVLRLTNLLARNVSDFGVGVPRPHAQGYPDAPISDGERGSVVEILAVNPGNRLEGIIVKCAVVICAERSSWSVLTVNHNSPRVAIVEGRCDSSNPHHLESSANP